MKFKGFVFDLDGTIYFGDKLAPKANEVIDKARKISNGNIFFLTNNSAKSRKEIFEKLLSLGIDVKMSEVYNSCYAVSKYLYNQGYRDVYCVGTKSLKEEITSFGINTESKKPQAVVVGYNKEFTLNDLNALANLSLENYKLIIANKERSYPAKDGIILPGAGPIVSAVEYLLNKTTDVLIGKPNPQMLDAVLGDLKISPDEICVVGDSFESDIQMAKAYGARSILISSQKNKDADMQVEELSEILEIIND